MLWSTVSFKDDASEDINGQEKILCYLSKENNANSLQKISVMVKKYKLALYFFSCFFCLQIQSCLKMTVWEKSADLAGAQQFYTWAYFSYM